MLKYPQETRKKMPPSKKAKHAKKVSSSAAASSSTTSNLVAFEYLTLAEGIISINSILSSAECEKQLDRKDDNDFEEESELTTAVKRKKVGKCDQFEFKDKELSKNVYAKCKDSIKNMVFGFSEEDSICKFNPVKIDSQWKLYRYKRGQHLDVAHIDSGRRGNVNSMVDTLKIIPFS